MGPDQVLNGDYTAPPPHHPTIPTSNRPIAPSPHRPTNATPHTPTSLNSYGMINVGYGCDPERTNEVNDFMKLTVEIGNHGILTNQLLPTSPSRHI